MTICMNKVEQVGFCYCFFKKRILENIKKDIRYIFMLYLITKFKACFYRKIAENKL